MYVTFYNLLFVSTQDKHKEFFIQLKDTKCRRLCQDIPSRLRRQISLETNVIQIQTNSPGAEGAVYQEISPSLLGRTKFVFLFLLLVWSVFILVHLFWFVLKKRIVWYILLCNTILNNMFLFKQQINNDPLNDKYSIKYCPCDAIFVASCQLGIGWLRNVTNIRGTGLCLSPYER